MCEGALRIAVHKFAGRNEMLANRLGVRLTQRPKLSTHAAIEKADIGVLWDWEARIGTGRRLPRDPAVRPAPVALWRPRLAAAFAAAAAASTRTLSAAARLGCARTCASRSARPLATTGTSATAAWGRHRNRLDPGCSVKVNKRDEGRSANRTTLV
jgi:hypothetical protein